MLIFHLYIPSIKLVSKVQPNQTSWSELPNLPLFSSLNPTTEEEYKCPPAMLFLNQDVTYPPQLPFSQTKQKGFSQACWHGFNINETQLF
jgi:hypothetical protein